MLDIQLNKSKRARCKQCGEIIEDEWRITCVYGDNVLHYHVDCVRKLVI